jgi:hypothetical protein
LSGCVHAANLVSPLAPTETNSLRPSILMAAVYRQPTWSPFLLRCWEQVYPFAAKANSAHTDPCLQFPGSDSTAIVGVDHSVLNRQKAERSVLADPTRFATLRCWRPAHLQESTGRSERGFRRGHHRDASQVCPRCEATIHAGTSSLRAHSITHQQQADGANFRLASKRPCDSIPLSAGFCHG